jgi:hypothetical protein
MHGTLKILMKSQYFIPFLSTDLEPHHSSIIYALQMREVPSACAETHILFTMDLRSTGFFFCYQYSLIKSIIPFRSFSDNNINCYHRSTTKHKTSQYYENKLFYVLSVGQRQSFKIRRYSR